MHDVIVTSSIIVLQDSTSINVYDKIVIKNFKMEI